MREVTLQILMILQQEFKSIELSDLLDKTQNFVESIDLQMQANILAQPIETLGLSKSIVTSLKSVAIFTVGQLAKESAEYLHRIFGLTLLQKTEKALKTHNLELSKEEDLV